MSTTPTPRAMGGKGGYLLPLQPSSPTKAMKFFGTLAQTSRRTAGLGGSRRPSSKWTVFRTTSSPRASIFLPPRPLHPRGTYSVCPLWRSTSPLPRRQQPPKVVLYPSLPPVMGDLGGAFAPSHRRLSRPFQSLRLVRVQLGDNPARIPNPMCTHPAWPIIRAPAVSLPWLAMGGSTAVGAAGHPHRLCPPSANHLPIPRFYGGGLTLQTCPIGGAHHQAMPLSHPSQSTRAV